ncbi:hypothetical protein M9Y10_023584 [Tritrichomonas musculus]|uniref:Serine/threonine-protein phosphatase 4 regulatory subunit 3-like central domain-containing protein n=1 Tax=Tritrichomonas musculus TaxID=1915356 RepID=A0ABR2KXF3_9EUKA
MFDEENSARLKFKLQSLRGMNQKPRGKSQISFPVNEFDSIFSNILKMYQDPYSIMPLKENLSKMKELTEKYQNEIFTIFMNRNFFPLLVEFLKIQDLDVQSLSLNISSNILLFHEEVVQMYAEHFVYQNVMNFFKSDYSSLIKAVSILFENSIITSPQNFLNIFINTFLAHFLQIFDVYDKNNASADIISSLGHVFLILFDQELKVDANILERVYGNILAVIYDIQNYALFFQFVWNIINNPELCHRFIKDSGFILFVLMIVNRRFNSKNDNICDYFEEKNMGLIVVSEIFKSKYMIVSLEKYKTVLDHIIDLISIKEDYDKRGRRLDEEMNINNDDDFDDDDENRVSIRSSLFEEISNNAIKVIISLVINRRAKAISFVSNHRIISNFIEKLDNKTFTQKAVMVELCLTVLRYSNDSQFFAFINYSEVLQFALDNIDPVNIDHREALENMLYRIGDRQNYYLILQTLSRYRDDFVRIQKEIEEDDINAKIVGSQLSLLILNFDKKCDEKVPQPEDLAHMQNHCEQQQDEEEQEIDDFVPNNDEGYLSDDQFE